MTEKQLMLILKADALYTVDAHPETDSSDKEIVAIKAAVRDDKLFDAITHTFIPLLKSMALLKKDEVQFKFALVLTPILCDLLSDKEVQSRYVASLCEKIKLGEKELERLSGRGEVRNIELALNIYKNAQEFYEGINRDILGEFYRESMEGNIELLATCATNVFLPLFSDIPSTARAQINYGLASYRKFFKKRPDGFWIPNACYHEGLEDILRANNVTYTALDAKSFFLSKSHVKRGIFYPAMTENCVVCFPLDTISHEELFGAASYSRNKVYLNTVADEGLIKPSADIKDYIKEGTPRHELGYKYYNNTLNLETLENLDKAIYNIDEARAQCSIDASKFLTTKFEHLQKAQNLIDDTGFLSLTVAIDLDKLRCEWREGTYWLECLFRESQKQRTEGKGMIFSFPRAVLENNYNMQCIKPYPACQSYDGLGDTLITDKNNYMIPYLRKASRRMRDIAKLFPGETGLRQRLLNLAAKELLIAQDCTWAQNIENDIDADYAKKRFKDSINDFTTVFNSLGSNELSTQWLTDLENKHKLFPYVNYQAFAS